MNKTKSPQSKAHDVIRLNRLLGLVGAFAITQTKINKYKTKFPNNGELIETILKFLYLPLGSSLPEVCEKISKKSGYKPSQVAKMFLHVVESVILCEKRVGKQLSLKPLIKFSKTNGSILNVVAKETVDEVAVKKVEGSYDSVGKRSVWGNIIRLLKDERSPKSGRVLTLSNMFQFETILIEMSKFKFKYISYEYIWSIYQEQLKKWQHSYKLRKHIECPRFGDLTTQIETYKDDSFSHIFADFCGQYVNGIERFTKFILSSKIVVKGGLVWLTYQSRSTIKGRNIRSEIEKAIKEYGKGNYVVEQINGERIYGYVGHQNNPDDARTGAKMVTLILRRVK